MTPPEAAPMREDVTQLLPCPRCGNRAFLTINFEVWCRTDRCLKLPPRASRAEAADAWNTRSYTARPDAGDEVERVARAISHVVNPWDHDGDQWEGYEDEARAALAAMREGVDRGMVEEVPAVPEWLAKVLAENVARFDALPLAIKNARFSYVAAAALSRKGG